METRSQKILRMVPKFDNIEGFKSVEVSRELTMVPELQIKNIENDIPPPPSPLSETPPDPFIDSGSEFIPSDTSFILDSSEEELLNKDNLAVLTTSFLEPLLMSTQQSIVTENSFLDISNIEKNSPELHIMSSGKKNKVKILSDIKLPSTSRSKTPSAQNSSEENINKEKENSFLDITNIDKNSPELHIMSSGNKNKVKILSDIKLPSTSRSKTPSAQNSSEENINKENWPKPEEISDKSDTNVQNVERSSKIKNKSMVTIYSARQDGTGKRIRDKGHACYFCQKIVINCARHFECIHGNETEIAKILAMPKNSKERRDAFVNIIRTGDFYHNSEVMSTKSGELILVRRPTENELKVTNFTDYGPCPNCLGFLLKKHIWHHLKTCTGKEERTNSRHTIAESDSILNATCGNEFTSDFIINISSKMRDDEIGNYCREDNLILKFGSLQFEKYGTTQCEMIRQSMRQLSRFTLKLRELENSNKSLSDYIVPQKFDLIVNATKSLCVSHQNTVKRPEFEIPSLALKIGYALKKCASIKRGICLRAGNVSGNETINCFLNLMELEWNIRISSNALATMYHRKLNATQLLPLTSDLIKLNLHIEAEMKTARDSLTRSPCLQTWAKLSKLTLSKVILFNKRRSGEASRMTLSNYSSRPLWSNQTTQELKNSLSEFEIKLANQLALVEIVGKRGRKVPVLLTADVKEAIDILIKTRGEVDINTENPYVFARSGNSVLNMRGHDCLRKVCSDAFCKEPQNITSTKLRKYIATVCQIFNLTENEYDWLARHLGHDIRVHREFYRMHESAVELTKVSRLLIAVDKGEANKFKGRKLEEINLEDIPLLEEDSEDEEELDEKGSSKEDNEKEIIDHKQKSNGSVCSSDQSEVKEGEPKSSKVNRRCPWTPEEKEALLKYFRGFIKRSTVPGKSDCLSCLEKHDVLERRSWTDVKFCVKNHLDKIKKCKK